jgi:protein SCO1/2
MKISDFRLGLIVSALLFCTACEDRSREAGGTGDLEIPELKDYEFGSDFALTDQYGHRFETTALRGKAALLFFGYTFCPDACPMTLSKLTRVYRLLGERANDVQTVYVSVDPERDTPLRLKEYLEYYGLPVIGLTGTAAEVDSAAGGFGVYYKTSDEKSEAGPLIDHTLLVYLLDSEGKLRYLFQPGESAEVMAGVIRRLF